MYKYLYILVLVDNILVYYTTNRCSSYIVYNKWINNNVIINNNILFINI